MGIFAFPFYILPYFNMAFAVAGLLLLGVSVVLAYDLLCKRGALFGEKIRPWLWPAIMLVTAGSVAVSLLYSEYFGFVPCSLCWLQRMAIYPQAVLAALAWRYNDTTFFPRYGMALSAVGVVVAVYHYIYQMWPSEGGGLLPCLADGSADCADKIIDLFGFVTFPFLSAVGFLFLLVAYGYLYRQSKG